MYPIRKENSIKGAVLSARENAKNRSLLFSGNGRKVTVTNSSCPGDGLYYQKRPSKEKHLANRASLKKMNIDDSVWPAVHEQDQTISEKIGYVFYFIIIVIHNVCYRVRVWHDQVRSVIKLEWSSCGWGWVGGLAAEGSRSCGKHFSHRFTRTICYGKYVKNTVQYGNIFMTHKQEQDGSGPHIFQSDSLHLITFHPIDFLLSFIIYSVFTPKLASTGLVHRR